jgi:fructose-1,6-bisphosphatase/inositol monophosphatase family enzyme
MSQLELSTAMTACHYAGNILRADLRGVPVLQPDGTPLTVNDRVREMIALNFPGDSWLGEADDPAALQPGVGERCWVFNPCDGAELYTAGIDRSPMALALVEDGVPTVAVIHNPWTGRTVTAIRGQGAHIADTGRRLPGNPYPELAGARIRAPWPGRSVRGLDARRLSTVLIDRGVELVNTGSLITDAVDIAYGYTTAVVAGDPGPWDIAAAELVLHEVGGRTTDVAGQAQRYDGPLGVTVMSNGYIHLELLEAIASTGPDV